MKTRFIAICTLMLLAHCPPALSQSTTAPAVELPEGINDRFLDPRLNADEFVERFERDGREAYEARNAILKAVGVRSGMHVADVGAGTGLFTVLFSREVGSNGWVYAVDISPKFVEHIATRAQEAGIHNITPVLCDQDSVNLPPESIDVAFVCDTYHHFAYPTDTAGSIYRALRPGGTLVVVDFIRDAATSSDWILGHVRAGKDVFTREIQSVGFEPPQEPVVEGLRENYLLVFRKAE
jgi:ubiquinone/menaquinone biosynthesis C-methylase UbiE